ncbi:LADA_0H06326g1_1 [Lachancea dasiensis]|uniref:LADA_0H06326g1_1 n=1 Tax=Lachancea dasiensis TaxID=1072105 RepID=A0A1G4K1L2_9SACH|nr:LADA_0H06326g1_1 [Lachancea dasiensis]
MSVSTSKKPRKRLEKGEELRAQKTGPRSTASQTGLSQPENASGGCSEKLNGRPDSAHEHRSRAMEFDRVLGEAYNLCGRLALEMGQPEAATANFSKAVEKNSQDIEAIVGYARSLGLQSGSEEIVISTLIDALKLCEDYTNYRIWAQLAHSYFTLSKPEDAFQSVSRAIAGREGQGVNDPELWVLQNRILLLWMDADSKTGLQTLVPYFTTAVQVTSSCQDSKKELQARVSLAQLYHRFACYAESHAELMQCLALVRQSPLFDLSKPSAISVVCYLYNFMSIIQFKLNQRANAYGLLREAMCILPQVSRTSRLLATLAQFYMIDGDVTSLGSLLPTLVLEREALLNGDQDRVYIYSWILGRIYDMLDDTKQSYEFYQLAISCKPQAASLWIAIGYLYLRMRQFEDAHIAFSHAFNYASKIENNGHPYLLRFNRLFAAFAWVGLSQVSVATFQKQKALDALRQASVLFASEGDVVHARQVDQIFSDVFASVGQNPVCVIMNVPPQILLELFLYYDAGIYSLDSEIAASGAPDKTLAHRSSPVPHSPATPLEVANSQTMTNGYVIPHHVPQDFIPQSLGASHVVPPPLLHVGSKLVDALDSNDDTNSAYGRSLKSIFPTKM